MNIKIGSIPFPTNPQSRPFAGPAKMESQMAHKTTNVNMATSGTYPSQFQWGPFHLPTDHPGFTAGLESLAGALGMSPKGLFYVIQYGGHQSVQDSIAGLGKKIDDAKDANGEPKFGDAGKKVILHATARERFDAIMAGEVGSRVGGPRAKGIDKLVAEIAWDAIVAKANALGKASALPKDAAGRKGMVEKYLADPDRAESARAEAERRLAIAASASGKADDLLDELGL